MKSLKFPSILAILAILLSACAPKAAPTTAPIVAPTTTVTEAPAAAEDPWGNIVIPAGQTLKVGLSSALAGGYAVYGQDMLNGVDLAIEKFGGSLKGFKLASEGQDDACEGASGVTVAEKFSSDPNILGVIGPMCTGSTVPAADIYGKNQVIMITPSSTAVVVTALGYENIFRTVPNDNLQANVTADYLKNTLNLSSIGIIHDQSIYGEGLAEAVKREFEALGGSVTTLEGLTRGESDYSSIVSTTAGAGPQGVYFGGMDSEGMKLVVQLRSANFNGIFFGPDGIKSQPSFADAAGAAAEGAFMTFGAASGAVGYDEFAADFRTRFGGDPVAYGPGSFDAATILLQAADRVAVVDSGGNLVIGRKALADSIRSTPFDGVTGHMEFDAVGDLKVVTISVFEVKDGKITPVKEYKFGE
jgi:branched-chain amino acid transport system substrate-binding protein